MSDTVIRVKNLSKSYTIRHASRPEGTRSAESYTALRDVLTSDAKSMKRSK